MVIAVVDDDARIRYSVENLLESAGHTALTFSSADEFVQAGPPADADWLVLDVRMPGMDGLDLQQLLQETRPQLRVVFITAHYSEAVRHRAMKQGAAQVLRKPFDGTELLRILEGCVSSDCA